MKKTNNILVTGGAGYIGSHIVEQLIKKNSNIIILDSLITGYKKLINKKAKFIKGDIKNKKKLIKIIKKFNINSIIHLAAFLNVKEAEKNKKKYFRNNVEGTLNLIHSCKNSQVKNIIFSSSCSIYGNVNGSVGEKKILNPKGYYAVTKLKGEKIIKKFSKKYNYEYAILRYFNVAGASSSGKVGEINASHDHLIKNLAIQSNKKKPTIFVYGNDYKTKDGTCIRDYIHVDDLADIHIKALNYIIKKKKSLILNCGYGKGFSVLDIIKIFKRNTKSLIVKYKPRRIGDVAQVYANNQKLKKLLSWKPRFKDLSKIIVSAIKWEKKLNSF